MKRIFAVLAGLALLGLTDSCTAATLTLRCTAPAFDDTATDCAAPILVPSAGGLVRMTFYGWSGPAWTGAPAFGDSSQVVAPGVAVTMTRNVPNAVYNCVVVAVDSLGNRSCSSSVVSKLARSKFAKVGDLH